MPQVKRYPHGTFSWADLSSTDQDGARSFYTQLFNWSANDLPIGEGMTYTMLQQGGLDVAGLGQMDPQQQAMGMPSVWTSYIKVDNVDEMFTRAQELGATPMLPPMDVFDNGRMAILQDPTGAVFAMWQPYNHIGASFVNDPNSLCWNELYTREPERAAQFYGDLFGWEASQDETGYYAFSNAGRSAGGMIQITDEMGDMPPYWTMYIAVEDADAIAARAEELGGRVIFGPVDAGQVGRMVSIQDPQGAVFSAIAMSGAQPLPEEWTR